MRVAWVVQRGNSGAREQSFELASHVEAVTPIYGEPLGIDHAQPSVTDEHGVRHATASLDAAIRDLSPDVVVFHNVNAHVVSEAPRIQQHTPTVLRAGLNFLESVMSGQAHASTVPQLMQFVQARDHVVAPSEPTKRDVQTLGVDGDRISVIPTALSMADDLLSEPDPNAPSTVGHLSARISPLKNQHTTIKAIGRIREIDPTHHVGAFITGQPNEYRRAFRQQVVQMGLTDRVEFVGYVDDPDEAFWPEVGVHVCPSFSERHPQVVLEAARAGVVSLVGDGGWAEVFPECFPRYPPDDPHQWATAIVEYLENDALRTRTAREQQAYVREHYAVDAVVPQYVDVLERVIDRVGPFKVDGSVLA
ncbi:MAG: glycosyltransferase family 4 protein [Haloarculaceae archaeon]